jgi:hypothetical protein
MHLSEPGHMKYIRVSVIGEVKKIGVYLTEPSLEAGFDSF